MNEIRERITDALGAVQKQYTPELKTYVADFIKEISKKYFVRKLGGNPSPAIIKTISVSLKYVENRKINLRASTQIDYGSVIANRAISVSRGFTVSPDTTTQQLITDVKQCVDSLITSLGTRYFSMLPHYYPEALLKTFEASFESVQKKPTKEHQQKSVPANEFQPSDDAIPFLINQLAFLKQLNISETAFLQRMTRDGEVSVCTDEDYMDEPYQRKCAIRVSNIVLQDERAEFPLVLTRLERQRSGVNDHP